MVDRIAELESRLAAVERRLSSLEGASSAEATPDRAALEPSLGDGFVSSASTHIGRVLLIFGGAYLLRAITDYQFVPAGLGIFMGASYGMYWLWQAWRKGGIESQRAKAAFYGCTSVLLLLPLLVEAVDRFELLSGPQGVAALAVFSALALGVAALRDLRSIGWLVIAGTIGTAVALLVVTHEAQLVAALLLLLGMASLWAVYWREWMGPRWLGALGANVGVIALLAFSQSDQWSLSTRVPIAFATVLLLMYLISFLVQTHRRGRDVSIFEVAQALAATGIAFVAAILAARSGQVSLMPIGMMVVVIGIGSYALAFTPETRAVRRQNFYYYSTLGLVLIVAGSALFTSPTVAAVAWSALAITMAWGSGRNGWVSLSLQSTVLLLAAGAGSGILATGAHALAGSAGATWPAMQMSHVGIAIATVVCLFIPVAQQSDRWGKLAGLPQLIVLALSVWEVGGLMVTFLGPMLADAAGAEPNAAVLAALRTAILSAASVTLALSSRHWRWPEARWLVYPVLILVAIKLFVEDFPNGQPATLFVSLAFLGGALLLVARLLKREEATINP
jgi:hypothetical protein